MAKEPRQNHQRSHDEPDGKGTTGTVPGDGSEKADGKDMNADDALDRALNEYYDDLLDEELPQAILDLLDRLKDQEIKG